MSYIDCSFLNYYGMLNINTGSVIFFIDNQTHIFENVLIAIQFLLNYSHV